MRIQSSEMNWTVKTIRCFWWILADFKSHCVWHKCQTHIKQYGEIASWIFSVVQHNHNRWSCSHFYSVCNEYDFLENYLIYLFLFQFVSIIILHFDDHVSIRHSYKDIFIVQVLNKRTYSIWNFHILDKLYRNHDHFHQFFALFRTSHAHDAHTLRNHCAGLD